MYLNMDAAVAPGKVVKGEEPQSAGQRLRLSFINILAVIVQLPLTKVPELIWRGFLSKSKHWRGFLCDRSGASVGGSF